MAPPRPLVGVLLALLCFGAAWVYVSGVSMERSLGWDESMHAGLPAARMALAAADGEPLAALEVAVHCQQYPFLFPAYLAGAQGLFGVGEWTMRLASRALWPLALLALWLIGRELAQKSAGREFRGAALVPWYALALGAASPLLLAFSGTLFLEVPSLVAGLFTLWIWLVRARADGPGAQVRLDLLAGLLWTAAFFTKFNYALLLLAPLALDFAIEAAALVRSGRARAALARAARLLAIPVLALAWWFLLPWPGDWALGADHRAAFLSFLGGNLEFDRTPWSRRLWELGTFLTFGPAALLVLAVGVAAALPCAALRPVRPVALVALVAGIAVLGHNFFLERFLLAIALGVWPMAAYGLARLSPAAFSAPVWRMAAATLGLVLVPAALAPLTAGIYADTIGARTETNREVLQIHHASRFDLRPGRALPTAGLAREEHDALLELVARTAGPSERVAWLGMSSELSPAALHFGLLARGGDRERFRRDAGAARGDGEPAMDVTFQGVDPGWSGDHVRLWARQFDLVFCSEPIDLRRRGSRRFLERYRSDLFATGEFEYERIGAVDLKPPFGEPYSVELFACRPVPR